MDVVYPLLIDSQNDNEELRYSLRSLTNIAHREVYVVGEKPEWATNIHHIPVPQNDSKYKNVRQNILTALSTSSISDDFIFMNDDFFIMKKLSAIPVLNYGSLRWVIDRYSQRYPEGSSYISSMKDTFEFLRMKGFPEPVSYELHVPYVINKKRALELLLGLSESSLHFRTIYGNLVQTSGVSMRDVKIFLDDMHNDAEYTMNPMVYMSTQQFLSVSGGAFKRGVAGEFIRSVFPDPSSYEIPEA